MSVSSLSTLMRKASDINSEIGEVGYFAALNLNYDSSAYEAKRNAEQLLRELNAELQGYEEMFGNDDNEEISFKSEIEYKRKLLQKIQYAAKILTDDGLRSDYLYEIQLRCYLSQAFTLAELKDRYSGRVFPFFMFEVSRKNGGLFQDGHHRFLCLNFIEMIIEEKKDNQVLRGFNCSSIKQIMPGFSVDEFYLSVENGEEQHTHHYQMKYWQQRELLIELVNFSKIAAQRRAFVKSEKMQNPNVSLKDFDKADDVANNILGTKPKSTSRPLKILFNDRVTPHKLLYQCQVYRKRSSLLAFDKKIWMTIGTSNIILSSDKEMKSILQIFPIAKDSVSFVKISDKGDFSIIINENKSCFHSCNAADAETILSLGKEITKGNFEYEQVITSLPYNKKDLDVPTLLFKKFNQINEKICETKELLTKLRTQRAEIKNMMIKEKQKTRSQTIYSTESKSILFSKTSVSNDDNFPKSQVSLFTLDEKDENLPSIAYLSQSSISASPFKRERLHAMTEVLDSPYSFGKEKDDIDSADDLNSNLTRGQKEKTSMKTLGGERKGKTPLYRRQDSKASSMNLSSQGFETRRATRFMSARIQMKTERALSSKQMPVSMKELTKEEDGMVNFSQDFQGQSLMNNFVNGEVKRNQQGYGDRTVRNSKNEISGSERKRQKLDV